ncbi:hypothetical protein [Micromonospora sp. RP3T]|uniref:hypothetical protein n=1 Tax=Micromonospora sp. RP3T TaxID=2135446 RepID=UPI003D70FFE4
MTAGEGPRTDPPFRPGGMVRGVGRLVFTDDGRVTLAEVRSTGGRPLTAEDVTAVLRPRKRPELAAIEEAVNRRIREVWPL